jgi:hypothetical protein
MRIVVSCFGHARVSLMNDAQLGYDPSVMSKSDGKRFIDIVRNWQSERLMITKNPTVVY